MYILYTRSYSYPQVAAIPIPADTAGQGGAQAISVACEYGDSPPPISFLSVVNINTNKQSNSDKGVHIYSRLLYVVFK